MKSSGIIINHDFDQSRDLWFPRPWRRCIILCSLKILINLVYFHSVNRNRLDVDLAGFARAASYTLDTVLMIVCFSLRRGPIIRQILDSDVICIV